MRPFLKWLGNKYRCMAEIKPYLKNGKRLIEPFTGSGAVFLNTDYSESILGEQNKDLINLYRLLKQDGEKFIEYAKTFFVETNNNSETYYEFREQFNAIKCKRQKSALFIYLNRHGYNGLCRYNKNGLYNVPFGRYKKPYFPEKEMLFFHLKSRSAHFYVADFKKTMQMASPGDVIYCDPPYVPLSSSANFTGYTKHPFAEKQQIELAKMAESLANKNISVIISNHDTNISREYYKSATSLKSFDVKRIISCNGAKRKPVKELLVIY